MEIFWIGFTCSEQIGTFDFMWYCNVHVLILTEGNPIWRQWVFNRLSSLKLHQDILILVGEGPNGLRKYCVPQTWGYPLFLRGICIFFEQHITHKTELWAFVVCFDSVLFVFICVVYSPKQKTGLDFTSVLLTMSLKESCNYFTIICTYF